MFFYRFPLVPPPTTKVLCFLIYVSDLVSEEVLKLAKEAINLSFAEPQLKQTLHQLFDFSHLKQAPSLPIGAPQN